MRELARSYYYLRDDNKSWEFYRKFLETRTSQGLDIYDHDDIKIAYVCRKLGLEEESRKLLHAYKAYAEQIETIYKDLNFALYYGYQNDPGRSLYHLEQFAEKDGINYLNILFLELDPLLDPVKELPQFQEILQKINSRQREESEALRSRLTEKGLI